MEGTGDQIDRNGHSVRGIGGAPFGTRPDQPTSYQTASRAAWTRDAVGLRVRARARIGLGLELRGGVLPTRWAFRLYP